MSDGPFKSCLPKRCWQSVADRAANSNYEVSEIAEAIPAALVSEFRELPSEFKTKIQRVMCDEQTPALFERRVTDELAALRKDAAGYPLAGVVLDCLEDAQQTGEKGKQALIKGTAAAFDQCYWENARSIEELAQSDQLEKAVTQAIRERLDEAALPQTRLDEIARSIWGTDDAPLPRAAPKREGIPDGPPIGEDSDE